MIYTHFISINRDTGHVEVGERLIGTTIEKNPVGEYVVFFASLELAMKIKKAIEKKPFLANKYIKTL